MIVGSLVVPGGVGGSHVKGEGMVIGKFHVHP